MILFFCWVMQSHFAPVEIKYIPLYFSWGYGSPGNSKLKMVHFTQTGKTGLKLARTRQVATYLGG